MKMNRRLLDNLEENEFLYVELFRNGRIFRYGRYSQGRLILEIMDSLDSSHWIPHLSCHSDGFLPLVGDVIALSEQGLRTYLMLKELNK